MILRDILVILIFITLLPTFSEGHGRMMDPPARNSMWRLGFNNPINYNDNELYCGGRMVQWIRNKGKCGICGDAYHGKKDHEAGGKFANGIIGRSYHEGEIIPVVVHLTANHQGWFEFKLCPVNDPKTKVTQKCLDKHVLQRADGKGTTFPIPQGKYNAFFNFSVKLPEGLTCKQCVMQWKYRTGNTWDKDDNSGVFCLGCGPQEEFYNCADVEILPRGQKSDWIKATVPTTGSGPIIRVTTTPSIIPPTIRGSRNNRRKNIMRTTSRISKAPTTSRPSKSFVTKVKITSSKLTTPKPTKLGKFKEKLRTKDQGKTSSQTYLIQPKAESKELKYGWKATATKKKLNKWLKKKPQKQSTLKPKPAFSKPKKSKLPSWLINTRKLQERRKKLVARRRELIRRQEELRRKSSQSRYIPKTSVTTPSTTTRRPTTTTTERPAKRMKESTPPCKTTDEKSINAADELSRSMIASTDIPDLPAAVPREYTYTQITTPLPQRSPIFITRGPKRQSYDHQREYVVDERENALPPRRLVDNYEYVNNEVNLLDKDTTHTPEYGVEFPEHPVIDHSQPVHPQVHRHRLPFRSKSPFANPSSPHANPLISYWWNQYQRPLFSLWNNVRPVLKCHATITLGGGMDEWCTANCNANFCPGGMCVCQPETSVYPTYSVYPPRAQSWMNSYTPDVHMDTPQPVRIQNPYILHQEQRRKLEAYKRQNLKQQQNSPMYTARNTIHRRIVDEAPDDFIRKQFAPIVSEKVTSQPRESNQIIANIPQKIQKRSTSSTTLTTDAPSSTTPISTSTAATTVTATTTPRTTAVPTTRTIPASTSTTAITTTTTSTTTSKPTTATTTVPTTTVPTTTSIPVAATPKESSSHSLSFKASNNSESATKRAMNTQTSTSKSITPKLTTRKTIIPERLYKASPSSNNEISKSHIRRDKLRSKIHFWRRSKNYNCHAIGRYAGLKRFDNWCSQNCMQTICPLLICQCEIIH